MSETAVLTLTPPQSSKRKVAIMNLDQRDAEETGGTVVTPEEPRETFMAISPWVLTIAGCLLIANVAVVHVLDTRLRDLRSEQLIQPSEINSKLRALEDKIEMLGGQVDRVERMALTVAEEDRQTAPCEADAGGRARHSPHQENVNDGRK